MQIGSFGDVIFRVEEENILTIKAMSREKKSRWEEAQILNDLSFLDFRGRDLTTVSLDIQLIETSKMKIVDTLNTLNNMLENGENHELILGNTLIGEFPFVLESMSEKFEKHQEQFQHVELSITLKEYRDNQKSLKQIREERNKKQNTEQVSEGTIMAEQTEVSRNV